LTLYFIVYITEGEFYEETVFGFFYSSAFSFFTL